MILPTSQATIASFADVLDEEERLRSARCLNVTVSQIVGWSGPQLPPQTAVTQIYSEFKEQPVFSETLAVSQHDWMQAVSKLEQLTERQLRALRKTVARYLHPDRSLVQEVQTHEYDLAVINSKIDSMLHNLMEREA